jgi:hypothetical protein
MAREHARVARLLMTLNSMVIVFLLVLVVLDVSEPCRERRAASSPHRSPVACAGVGARRAGRSRPRRRRDRRTGHAGNRVLRHRGVVLLAVEPALERWVLNLPHIGPMVHDYRLGSACPGGQS